MKPYLMLAGVLAAMLGSVQAAGLYRWVDQSGKVHYGDVPAAEAGQPVEKKKFSDVTAADNADLPYETRRAHQNFPVTLYVADNCGEPCQRARDFLNQRGIPFSEKNLAAQKEIDDFKQRSGSDQTPTLLVGKNWLNGFLKDQWNDELDISGYPKIAPYRPPAPAKPAPVRSPADQSPAARPAATQ